jgi:hypothetical protein
MNVMTKCYGSKFNQFEQWILSTRLIIAISFSSAYDTNDCVDTSLSRQRILYIWLMYICYNEYIFEIYNIWYDELSY